MNFYTHFCLSNSVLTKDNSIISFDPNLKKLVNVSHDKRHNPFHNLTKPYLKYLLLKLVIHFSPQHNSNDKPKLQIVLCRKM